MNDVRKKQSSIFKETLAASGWLDVFNVLSLVITSSEVIGYDVAFQIICRTAVTQAEVARCHPDSCCEMRSVGGVARRRIVIVLNFTIPCINRNRT